MLQISPPPKSRNTILWVTVIVSLLLHLGFYAYSSELVGKIKKHYQPIHVALQSTAKKKTEPKPPPQKVEENKPKPKPKPKEEPPPEQPKPNVEKPPEAPPPAEPPQQVFGATQNSVIGNDGSSVAIRVGNTLGKEMEKDYVDPNAIKPLAPPPPPPTREVKPVPMIELTELPSFKFQIKPDYPEEARRMELEGVVELEVLIDERGKVIKVRVLKTPGYGFEKAAIEALKKSEFNPGRVGSRAVPVKLKIPFRFVLED